MGLYKYLNLMAKERSNNFHQETTHTKHRITLHELALNTINNPKHNKKPFKYKATFIVIFLASTRVNLNLIMKHRHSYKGVKHSTNELHILLQESTWEINQLEVNPTYL